MERNQPPRQLQALLRRVLDGHVVAGRAHNAVQELLLRLPTWVKELARRTREADPSRAEAGRAVRAAAR
jgi:hypothetical protein